MAEGDLIYRIYRAEGAYTGIAGYVFIVKYAANGEPTAFYTFADGKQGSQAKPFFEAQTDLASIQGLILPESRQATQYGEGLYDFNEAKFEALRLQTNGPYRVQLLEGVPFAWLAITQLIIIAFLWLPGVQYIGSAYATSAHVAVLISVLMNNSPYLMTAARVSTAVAVGNVMLALLAWQSGYSMADKVSAAFRAAVVVAVGFATIVTNEYLHRVASPMRFDDGNTVQKPGAYY
jgi:hypothetical protein